MKQLKEKNVAGVDKIVLDEFLTLLMSLAEAVQDIANNIVGKTKDEEYRKFRDLYDLGLKSFAFLIKSLKSFNSPVNIYPSL